MEKYVTSINKGENKTAGIKAHKDIELILVNEGFRKLDIDIPDSKIERALKNDRLVKQTLKNFTKNSMVVYQYPSYSRVIGERLIKELKKMDSKIILILHDVESLRLFKEKPKDIRRELKFFSEFDLIISHNVKMSNWLILNGINVPIKNIELFDYLNSSIVNEPELNKPIVFAGHLGKSKFLEFVNIEKKIDLCGIEPSKNYPQNMTYLGAFEPEELGNKLNGSFGLVWDGDSTRECTGLTGEYMRYNNPHKISLYLSLGLPVIIWKKAALAEFIESRKLGIAIDSIDDIDSILASISDHDYKLMKDNALVVSGKVGEGYFLKRVLGIN